MSQLIEVNSTESVLERYCVKLKLMTQALSSSSYVSITFLYLSNMFIMWLKIIKFQEIVRKKGLGAHSVI